MIVYLAHKARQWFLNNIYIYYGISFIIIMSRRIYNII